MFLLLFHISGAFTVSPERRASPFSSQVPFRRSAPKGDDIYRSRSEDCGLLTLGENSAAVTK
jgi:hypothetical protein